MIRQQPAVCAPYQRYLVFSIEDHYPAGGLGDVAADADTLEDATKAANAIADGTVVEVFDCEQRVFLDLEEMR